MMEQELQVPWRTSSSRSSRRRSPPGRSGRCIARRSRTATTSSSRCSGRGRARRSRATSGCSSSSPRRRSTARRCAAPSTSPRSCSTSPSRCAASSTSRRRREHIDRMRDVLAAYTRLGVPGVYRELSTSRLLVLEFVDGVPLRESSTAPSAARRDVSCSRRSTSRCSSRASSTPTRTRGTCCGPATRSC